MAEKSRKPSKLAEIFAHYTDGKKFLRRCAKPSWKEFFAMLKAHMAGILFLGSMGYLIKLVHIPINNVIVGNSK